VVAVVMESGLHRLKTVAGEVKTRMEYETVAEEEKTRMKYELKTKKSSEKTWLEYDLKPKKSLNSVKLVSLPGLASQ
jgi:hypothetical protein